MIEMPPLQFAETNGIRMGYYEAGPKTDTPPVILCHGWPEIAFSWRNQIKALGDAGIRVIAPDQRGYGATDRPEPVEAYDIEHLTDDLVGLLDHLGIDKAIFVGHDWGGFIVWQMPLRHIDRVAGVVGINTPHTSRAPADPIELLRQRFAATQPGVSADDCRLRCETRPADADPVAGGKAGLRRYLHQNGLHRRYQLAPQHVAQLAALCGDRSHRAGAVADDHGRERSRAATILGRRHGENHPRPREIPGSWQRPLDAAGKAGRSQRQADRMA